MNCSSKHFFFSTDYKLFLKPKYMCIGKDKQEIKYQIKLSLSTVIKWILNKDFTFQGFQFKRKNKWKTISMKHDDCLLLKDYIDGKVSYLNLSKVYNIISCLRQCFSSKVYLCKCCINQEQYNLQIFKINDLNSKEYINLLEMINLNHPNIIKFLEYFVEESNLYVITQKLEGKSLKDRINSQYKMEINEIIYTLKALLDLTIFTHQIGYVFRDLSTTNIFLTNAGEIFLIDFEVLVKVEEAFRTKAGTKDKDLINDLRDSIQFKESEWHEVEKFYHEQYDVLILGQILREMLINKIQQKNIQGELNQYQTYGTIITNKSTKSQLYKLLFQMLEIDPKIRIKPQNALYFLSDMEFDDDSYQDFPDSSENQNFQILYEFQSKPSINN